MPYTFIYKQLLCLFYNANVLFHSLTERRRAISQSVREAKEYFKLKEETAAKLQAERERKLTSTQLLARFFKKGSEKALKIGKAQLMYEDMVRRAEKKLSQLKRISHTANVQSPEAKAEELAQELFHRPGSMLTSDEIAHMWIESSCQELREEPDCNFPTVNLFRTIDGTCNNLKHPLLGAAGTAFTRLIPAQYEDGVSFVRGGLQGRSKGILGVGPFVPPIPSARVASANIVFNISDDEIPITHVLMQWGQFIDHDLDLAPELEEECESCEFTDVCEPIQVPDIDPAFGVNTPNEGDCLPLRRSLPACDTSRPGQFLPREHINDLTSFIDGSMIYGSSNETEASLRAFSGGLLLTGDPFPGTQETLPRVMSEDCPSPNGCFIAGDVRVNEQVVLTVMHTVWLREHNRIARALAELNPSFSDERLFQEARRIVGAVIQKITYQDYLPLIFGPVAYPMFFAPYEGYNDEVDPGVPNVFAAAAYRYGHSLIKPYFDRLGPNFEQLPTGPLNLVNAFMNPDQFTTSNGTDPLVRGLITLNARRVDEFINSVLTTQLFETDESPGMDLVSLNIQRARDHGIPPYPFWKNFCTKIFNISSDFENELTLVRFLQTYGSLDSVDVFPALLAEDRLPESLFGATLSCLFGITFSNIRDGDRFYYANPGVFSPEELEQINVATLSRVFCDTTDIGMIQPNAFLSNQSRVPCSDIPQMDLSVFQRSPCFARISVTPRNIPTAIRGFSRSIRPFRSFSARIAPPSSEDVAECLPITCPIVGTPDDIIVYSSEELLDILTITPNDALPASSISDLPGVYRATIPVSEFVPSAGLFTSLDECKSGSESFLTFTLPTTKTAKLESVLLGESMQQKRKGFGRPESPETDENVPWPILRFLREENDDAKVLLVPLKSAEKSSEESNDELLKDLEVALKALSDRN